MYNNVTSAYAVTAANFKFKYVVNLCVLLKIATRELSHQLRPDHNCTCKTNGIKT